MIELLLLLPILTVIGWLVSRRIRDRARRIARTVVVLPAAILVALTASGSVPPNTATIDFHRWCAHALVIAIWVCAGFTLGIMLERHIRTRPAVAIAQSALLAVALAITSFASFTGYIDTAQAGEGTKNRFVILHMYALPIGVACLLFVWWRMLRAKELA